MADSSTNMEQVSFSQALAATVINALVDAMSQAAFGGRDRATTSGTTWGTIRGAFSAAGAVSTLADTTTALTSNATNYVEHDSAGAVSANTTGFTAGRAPLYEVVVNNSGVVTSYSDRRVLYRTPWINERLALTFSADANKTLTAAEARARFLDFTSGGTTLTATRDVIVPLNLAEVTVRNNSPGGQSIRVIGATGTGITIANGSIAKVMGDGTNIIQPAAATSGGNPTESLIVAVGDESTALTAGTAKVTFRMPYALTLTAVRASLKTAQSSGSIFTVDINEGGSTILSTKLTIDNGEKTSTTATTPPVLSDTSLADDAEITVDIDQVGDGTAVGLKIVLIGTRT